MFVFVGRVVEGNCNRCAFAGLSSNGGVFVRVYVGVHQILQEDAKQMSPSMSHKVRR